MEENIKVIYEDENLLVIDKPSGIDSESFKRRVHRLDKDTSGILLIAKTDEALKFFQEQFKKRRVKKKYLALVWGHLKNNEGEIKTLIGRSLKNKRKQSVYLPFQPKSEGKREAITKYKLIKRYKDYDLVEAEPITGRMHQIRVHFSYLKHPVVGDKIYGFKNQKIPKGLKRQFLHAYYLKIKLPNGEEKEFKSELPPSLKKVLENLEE
jgi:23S rRNA pseudouridine1911/1915/1917 synthase